MLIQQQMIERLRQVCLADERLEAAMLYGSFPLGEADEYSDIDCLLYFVDEAQPTIDQPAWLSQIAPLELYYINEFGVGDVIFANLVRGEFHFDRASDIAKIESWRGIVWFPSLVETLLLDRTGRLTHSLQTLIGPPPIRDEFQEAQFLCNSLANWTLFGSNVLARGEAARALEILSLIHGHLLHAARLLEGTTVHWITPTRALEREISPAVYERFRGCTALLDPRELREAYQASWDWSLELMAALAERYEVVISESLLEKLSRRLGV